MFPLQSLNSVVLKFYENAVSIEFWVIYPRRCVNCGFPLNLHTRKLDETLVFYKVFETSYPEILITFFYKNVHLYNKVL